MFNKKKLISRIITTAYSSKEGHIASSLSILDILYVLYSEILQPNDKLILSKGHASLGLYAILEHFNLLEEDLNNFCKFNSKLGGHPTNKIKNVSASTGSLGHGLPMGIGIAMAEKIKNTNNKIYTIIGDGESNEGTIWESLLLASHHKLNNLVCILDYNHSNDRALLLNEIKNKINAFNCLCMEIDGHDHNQILSSLKINPINQPLFIIANTIKGSGINIMENNHEWHHKTPNSEDYNYIMSQLK
jgi:transketolase